MWRPAVWEELERRGATVALVPFWGRAGSGGRTDTIKLLRLEDGELLDVERWTYRDELAMRWRRRCGSASERSSVTR